MKIKLGIAVLIIFVVSLSSGCIETGKGTSIDTVYGIEYTGLIWKTYTVYLTNDHPSAGKEVGTGYSAKYTLDSRNTELIEFLEEASRNQKKIRVYYTNNVGYFPWEHTSDAVVLIYNAEYV